jgi:hypothetical protein
VVKSTSQNQEEKKTQKEKIVEMTPETNIGIRFAN